MSLLSDLRLDIGDDNVTPFNSGVTTQVAYSNSPLLIRHLRLDIGDDISLVVSSGNASDSLEINGYLQVEGAAAFCGPQYLNTRFVTSSGTVFISDTDHIVMINKLVGEPTPVILPTDFTSFCGQRIISIKDMKGDAATNNITIMASSGLIDGQSSVLINNNYQSYTFIRNQYGWSAI